MRTALAFLTRIPVPAPPGPPDLDRAAVWFPVVGLLVGAVMGGTRWLAGLVLDPAPATLLALLAAILVTGGFHEDGLADTADAAGAHVGRERKLEILRDSRVGTYGALAVVFMVLFPFSVLAPLSAEDVARAALVGHALGRWSSLPLSRLAAHARPDGKGALLHPSWARVVLATPVPVAAALLLGGPAAGAAALGAAVLGVAGGALVARRVFGGVTGDLLGATNKVVELAAYAALAAVWAA